MKARDHFRTSLYSPNKSTVSTCNVYYLRMLPIKQK